MTYLGRTTPEQRAVADRLYQGPPFWRGPCGHAAPSMWVDGDLTIRCSVVTSERHGPTPPGAWTHECGPLCHMETCGRTYTADDLSPLDGPVIA